MTMETRPADGEGRIVADLMLRDPKTLPADASVSDAILTDGHVFRGAITEIPADAQPDGLALEVADTDPETIAPDVDAATALARTSADPSRRLIVLDRDRTLLGLLCLNQTHTRFCGATGDGTVAES